MKQNKTNKLVEPDWERLVAVYNKFQADPSIACVDELDSLADEGSVQSMVYLGVAYRDGLGVNIDEEKAEGYFVRANDLGFTIAGYYLGRLYLDQKNYKKSFEILSSCEEDDYAPTLCCLGYLYLEGYGVEKQTAKAKLLFEKSSKMGNIWAKRRLAKVYMTGDFGLFHVIQGVFLFLISLVYGMLIFAKNMSDERLAG